MKDLCNITIRSVEIQCSYLIILFIFFVFIPVLSYLYCINNNTLTISPPPPPPPPQHPLPQVLFKSAQPIVTMLIGITWFRKRYPPRDYFVVILLVVGLYVFMSGDATAQPTGTGLGILLVTLSLIGSASVPMVQEHCMAVYDASVEELLYIQYLGSTVVSFFLAFVSGDLLAGVSFLLSSGDVYTWLRFIAFCSFGFWGANFSTALTKRFGALVNGITNTARKAVTLALSFALFPERNTLTPMHEVGAVIFFSGLLVRVFNKGSVKKTGVPSP